jgi:hypothetical protein
MLKKLHRSFFLCAIFCHSGCNIDFNGDMGAGRTIKCASTFKYWDFLTLFGKPLNKTDTTCQFETKPEP